jgi:hypothetical protein
VVRLSTHDILTKRMTEIGAHVTRSIDVDAASAATNLADLGASDFHLGHPLLIGALTVLLAGVLGLIPPAQSPVTRLSGGLSACQSRTLATGWPC